MAAPGSDTISIYVDPEDSEPNGSSRTLTPTSRVRIDLDDSAAFDPVFDVSPGGPLDEQVEEKQNQDLKKRAEENAKQKIEDNAKQIRLNWEKRKGLRDEQSKRYIKNLRKDKYRHVTGRNGRKKTQKEANDYAERRRLRKRQKEASKTLSAGGSPNKKNVTRRGVRKLRL